MEFKKFEGLVYDVEKEVIGVLALTNNLTGEAVVVTEDGEVTSHLDNLMKLEKIMQIGDADIVDGDVFSDAEGKLWEITLLNDDMVVWNLLDNGLNRVQTYEPFHKSELVSVLPNLLTLEGHILELEAPEEEVVDFNIKIVKHEDEYIYACNNKETGEVDLISVVFMGSALLEEEDYQRVSLSHEDYLGYLETGYLEEVTPQELQNYVVGLMSGQVATKQEGRVYGEERICGVNCGCNVYCEDDMYDEEDEYEDEDEDEDEKYTCDCDFCVNLSLDDEDEDTCYDCGEYHEDCDC